MDSYVKLRRGLRDHLSDMTGLELKVYIYLLISARFQPPNVGTLTTTARDIASDIGSNRTDVVRVLKKLSEPHGSGNVRYIEYSPGVNQYDITHIRILKYAVPKTETPTLTPTLTADGQHTDSTTDSVLTAYGQHTTPDLGKEASKNGENGFNGENGKNDPPTPPEEDDGSPEQLEAGRFRDVVGIWEQVIGAVPSQKTRETLRAWVTVGYSDAAIESALKTAVKNKANAPAQYATSILRSGNADDDDDAEYRQELASMFANRRIF